MKSQMLILLILSITTYTTLGFSKYGRTCADIGCLTNEICIMAEDPCPYRGSEGCGSYPTCQRKPNAVANCDTHVCPPTTYCRMDGSTPKCIADNGPLGGSNPNANLDPHKIHSNNNHEDRPTAPLYPSIPRGQTSTRPPMYRPSYNGGGYQGGSIGSGYPGQSNNGGGYGGGTIGGGYPGGYSGYPSQNNNPYAGYPNNNGYSSGGRYPTNNNGYSNYPHNTNPYYGANNNNRYGYNDATTTTANPLFNTLKNLGKKLLKDAIGNIKF